MSGNFLNLCLKFVLSFTQVQKNSKSAHTSQVYFKAFFLYTSTYLHTAFNSAIFQDKLELQKRDLKPLLTCILTHNKCTTLSHVHIMSLTHLLTQPSTDTLEMQTLVHGPKCCTNKSVDSASQNQNKIRNISNTHSLKNKNPHKFTPLELKKDTLEQHLLHHLCSVGGRVRGRVIGCRSVVGEGPL